jgi:hypothetical protein
MTYRDDRIASASRLVVQRDEALARVADLEKELEEARGWLKRRAAPRAPRLPRAAMLGGYGSLVGSILGTVLSVGLGSPLLLPLATFLGALTGALIGLGDANAADSFPPPSDTHSNLR